MRAAIAFLSLLALAAGMPADLASGNTADRVEASLPRLRFARRAARLPSLRDYEVTAVERCGAVLSSRPSCPPFATSLPPLPSPPLPSPPLPPFLPAEAPCRHVLVWTGWTGEGKFASVHRVCLPCLCTCDCVLVACLAVHGWLAWCQEEAEAGSNPSGSPGPHPTPNPHPSPTPGPHPSPTPGPHPSPTPKP
jgi:hypothetical protein